MDDSARERWDELFAVYTPYHYDILVAAEVDEAAELLAALADAAPDDDHLSALAISLVEAFMSRAGSFPAFERALVSSPKLRTAWCHAWSAVPDEWEERFNALVRPEDRPPEGD